MNIEVILNEDNKNSNIINSLKEWFTNKKEQSKEFFQSLKFKVSNIFKKQKSNNTKWTARVDIFDKNGNKIIEAGASRQKVEGVIQKILMSIKNLCSEIINFCTQGINLLLGKDTTKAFGKKNKVIEKFKDLQKSMGVLKKCISLTNKYVDVKANAKANKIIKSKEFELRSRERELRRKEDRINRRRYN